MSDADDQMGGSGGDTGRPPGDVVPGKDNTAPAGPGAKERSHAAPEELPFGQAAREKKERLDEGARQRPSDPS